jgi:hypothetical protein
MGEGRSLRAPLPFHFKALIDKVKGRVERQKMTFPNRRRVMGLDRNERRW